MRDLDPELWEALLRKPSRGRLLEAWSAAGLAALAAFALAEPFSAALPWPARAAVMVLRGVLLVETLVYAYRRYLASRRGFLDRARRPAAAEGAYARQLADMRLLHLWDRSRNFATLHPLLDLLFGTYLDPDSHRAQLAAAAEDALTVSDAVEWRRLLKEASAEECAVFIARARRRPRQAAKLEALLACLERRLAKHPAEVEALDLHIRGKALLRLLRPAGGDLMRPPR